MSEDWGGPYVLAALFCGEVRIDANGIHTVVNIIDEITVSGENPSPSVVASVHLYLRFARGGFAGKAPVWISLVRPDDSTERIGLPPVDFFEPLVTHYLDVTITVPVYQPGALWGSIFIGDRMMSRVRMSIRHRPSS